MRARDQFPGLALGSAVIFSALAASAAPPPEQTVSQWSDQHREIAPESGARITGRWRTATAPYMRRPMDVGGVDHPAASVWLRWSAKTGKTQVFLNAAMHCIDTAPRSMMVVCPSDQKQKDFVREVLEPNVRATHRINLKVLPTRSRSGDGSTTNHKRFRGGFLKIINGSSEGQLQQSDIGLVIFEEPSSYPADVGGRGPPVRQGRARMTAWGDDAKELGGGTPKFIGDCVVTAEVERRTCERYYLPCPYCGALQVLLWENMGREGGRPYFTCQHEACGRPIGHEHKLWMLDQADQGNGGWLACFHHVLKDGSPDPDHPNQPPPPCIAREDWAGWVARRGPDTGSALEGRDPSFDGIWQAYSPFTVWSKIYEAYDEACASGKPEDLVTFWQQVLGLPFEAQYDRPETERLFESRNQIAALAQLERGLIPPWAWALFGAADVQGDRIEWAVWAVGPAGLDREGAKGRRFARIDAGVIPVPPVDPQAWDQLAEITRRTYEGPACLPLRFDRFGVDTGGHHTNRAYLFCSGRPNVMALKGARDKDTLPLQAGSRRKAVIDRRVVAQVQLYLVGTHKVKKDVYFGLAQALASLDAQAILPGAVMLDPAASEGDFEQITAEVLLPRDPAKGRREEAWDLPAGKRNEQLDMAVYCHAMAWSFLPDQMTEADWGRLIAARRRDPATAGSLPLETIWSGTAETPAPPSPAAVPADASAARTAESAFARLARLNRGDTA